MQDSVSKEISKYLDSVKAHLGHLPPGERQAVLDNLELQIADVVRQRLGSQPPTADDVRAVISEMDPPESFGSGDSTSSVPRISTAYLRNVILMLVGGFLMTSCAVGVRWFLPLTNIVNRLTGGSKAASHEDYGWLGIAAGMVAFLMSLTALAGSARAVKRDRPRRWLWIALIVIAANLVLGQFALFAFIGPRMADLMRDLK
jgi:hypothetical protein